MARLRGLYLGGDVDDEAGADFLIDRGVNDFEGAEGFVAAVERESFEAGEPAGFVAKFGGVVVVGMAAFPVGKDDSFGSKSADAGGEFAFIGFADFEAGIGEAVIFAGFYFYDFCGGGGFSGARFGSAPGAHFAASEVEDAGAVTELGHLDHGGAGGELGGV